MSTFEIGKVYLLPVEEGFVIDPPVWNPNFHKAKNWMAVLKPDPHSAEGFTREWAPRGKGRMRYDARATKIGDPIEFGADRIGNGGYRQRERWYGLVVNMEREALWIQVFADADSLLDEARGWDSDQVRVLTFRRNVLRDELDRVEEELRAARVEAEKR